MLTFVASSEGIKIIMSMALHEDVYGRTVGAF